MSLFQKKIINNWHFLDTETSRWFISQAKKHSTKEECSEHYNYGMFFLCIEPLFAELKKPRRVGIDIGASYGQTVIAAANFFEKVYAFEIDPGVRECLRLNVEEYPNVKVFNCGISNSNDQMFYNVFIDTGHNCIELLSEEPRGDRKGRRRGTIRTLDSFAFKNVDYIKIDVEGAEDSVIQGAHNLLTEQDPVLIIELWNSDYFEKVSNLLKPYGYEYYKTHKISDAVYETLPEPRKNQLTNDHVFLKKTGENKNV